MAVVRDGQERKSSTSSATDGLAIPDDNDASSRGPLLGGFSIFGVLACGNVASDDDDSFAHLSWVHNDLVYVRAHVLVYA
jgi:hypothetical protein